MRILFALSGLHRVNRGAEVAFESVADEVARLPGRQVTLIGSGAAVAGRRYRYVKASCLRRERFERWPSMPFLRDECAYEDLSFASSLIRAYRSDRYDLTVTCGYPYTNWLLRARRSCRGRPPHVFVTQNGEWPARRRGLDYRFFGCEGLVCLNPEDYERHRDRWPTVLIPNGLDPDLFRPGPGNRALFGLRDGAPVGIMVSALIPSKRVEEGIRCAARVPDLQLLVLGDGPLRSEVDRVGREVMGDRYRRGIVARSAMPEAYRCADVVLHMSRGESFGNVYVEGLAMGLPVVAQESVSTRWILEDAGVLVDTGRCESVVAGIERALGLGTPDLRDRRRRRAVERFGWRAIAVRYCEFFERVRQGPWAR